MVWIDTQVGSFSIYEVVYILWNIRWIHNTQTHNRLWADPPSQGIVQGTTIDAGMISRALYSQMSDKHARG